jgi:hypothetical protein
MSRWIKGCLIAIGISVIIALAAWFFAVRPIISQALANEMYSYQPIDNDPIIARLMISKTGTGIRWKVQLIVNDGSGKRIDRAESCDTWHLTADIITIRPLVAVNVPSGWYVLTTLVGTDCLDEHGNVDDFLKEFIPLDMNSGPVKQDGLFVSLRHVSSNSIGPDGKTYNAIIDSTSLILVPTS